MKKNINDYKETKTAIEVNSIEEFDRIKELLGHNQKGSNCFTERTNYISCFNDGYDNKEWWINKGFTLYKASDFLEETPKFEEGKWYKVNDKYTKFLILENESLIFGSEHIYNNKHYISELKTGTWISKLSDNPVLLTDLSEIQQYLPPNHPDLIVKEIIPEYVEYIDTKYKGQIVKIEEWTSHNFCCIRFENGKREQPFKHLVKFSTKEKYEAQNKPKQLTVDNLIKGEIYVLDTSSTKNFISKFDYIESDNYYDSCFIQGDDFDNDPEFATISDIKSIRLATNEEKKWLNTCISQDKFISKEDLHLYDDSGLLIWEIGCYYKLNFTDNTSTYIKLSKKVDDRIYGNEYTDSTGKWYYNEIIWSTKQLKTHEKVDKPDQKIKDMFKKDDYIYVLGGETTTGKNCKDKVLKIESVDLKSLNKPFVTTDYDKCGGIYFDEIRIATATEINTLYIHKKEEWIPKVGDWCVTTTHYNDEIWYKGRIWQIGKIDEDGYCIPIENKKLLEQSLKIGFRKALPHEIPNQYPLTPNESFQTTIYDFGDIYIAPITKKTKKLQTITIESTTNLNLNLRTIKPKQIKTIKI